MQKFIVVRENKIIRVYCSESVEGNHGVKQALKNLTIDFKDVNVHQVLDDFEYSEGDLIYPYDPKDKRPQSEIIQVNSIVAV